MCYSYGCHLLVLAVPSGWLELQTLPELWRTNKFRMIMVGSVVSNLPVIAAAPHSLST